jgi:hypothetical protein
MKPQAFKTKGGPLRNGPRYGLTPGLLRASSVLWFLELPKVSTRQLPTRSVDAE